MTKFIQFISGAVCPSCKAIDTIAISKDNDHIYCVKCDFKETRPGLENKKTNKASKLKFDTDPPFKRALISFSKTCFT